MPSLAPIGLSIFVSAVIVAAACGSTTVTEGTGGTGGADTSMGGGPTSSSVGGGGNGAGGIGGTSNGGMGGTSTAGVPDPVEVTPCGNQVYECGDLVDNDADGLTDFQDPDCLGPCDNSEDSYHPGLASPWTECHLDCFWDTGGGHEEGCYWNLQCDPYANDMSSVYTGIANPDPSCTFSGSDAEQQALVPPNDPGGQTCDAMFAAQSQQCLDTCGPMVPNGCDCFGCCELGGTYVWLWSVDQGTGYPSCDASAVGNVGFLDDCHPCTPVPACNNPCETCEICIGKTSLPASCSGAQLCPTGAQACGLSGQPLCPSGETCITGCCVPLPT